MLEEITIMNKKNMLEKTIKRQNRDTLKTLNDILLACSNKNPILSHISREANLNDTSTKPLLIKLIKIGYVKDYDTGRSRRSGNIIEYSITPKGYEFLNTISEWININD